MYFVGRKALTGIALFLVALFTMQAASWAQGGSTTIRGTVTDAQGAAVAHAKVTINSPAKNLARSQETTASGAFSFELIPVGDYNVFVEAAGFRKSEFKDIHGLVDNSVTIDVKLELGSLTETVQVEASAAIVQINTQDATLGNNIESAQIVNLPLESRNVLALLTLQPQVTPDGYVAGGRSDQSNVTLDGVDINDAETSDVGKPVLRLNTEAVEEFRVVTVGANADEGRSSAAQINLVTKSGTNSLHGSLFEFNRNTAYTANDFFNKLDGVDRAKLIRNTFGGVLGGPVVKDKLFFFYSYEGRRDKSDTSITTTVPRGLLGQGQLSVDAERCTKDLNAGTTTCEDPQTFVLTTPAAGPGVQCCSHESNSRFCARHCSLKICCQRQLGRRRRAHGRFPIQRPHAGQPELQLRSARLEYHQKDVRFFSFEHLLRLGQYRLDSPISGHAVA